MNTPENKKPKIHLNEKAPPSRYVIDLRRPSTEVMMPRISRDVPVERLYVAHVAFDPLADLLPTNADLVGQLSEQDFTPGELVFDFTWTAPLLVNQPMHEVMALAQQEALLDAYESLELPLDEEETAEMMTALPFDLDLPEEELTPSPISTFQFSFSSLRLPHGWQKAIAAFVGLSFLFVLPIHAMQQVAEARESKTQIESISVRAISNLTLGSNDMKASNFHLASSDFAQASSNFASAQSDLDALSGAVDVVLKTVPQTSSSYTSLTALIKAGQNLSKSAGLFASALSEIQSSTSDSPITKLDILTVYLERMQPLLSEAVEQLTHVNVDSLPEGHRATVSLVVDGLPHLSKSVDEFLTFNATLKTILGAEQPMRYLLLFQNNAEMRPTGGFIGSFAEMTVDNGKITDMQVPSGGSYDLQGSLDQFVQAPNPLQLLKARWEFQDGNWFPDFPTSAEKLLWFYDHAGGPTVDGVLSVNATFVADLIDLLGPVDMPSYDKTINSDNFLVETQKIVESEDARSTSKPKQFISDLAPKLLSSATSSNTESFVAILQKVGNGLSGRDIQLYFKDSALQKTMSDLGWSGSIAQTSGDYLMIVDTNLGGGKTDLVIDQNVSNHVVISSGGQIEDTVTITRTHNGKLGDPFSGVNNVDYLRLYVPQGSELIAATGDFSPPDPSLFKTSDLSLTTDTDLTKTSGAATIDAKSGTNINNEFNKTVFGNWVQTKPGTSSTVSFTYRLPFSLSSLVASPSLLDRLKGIIGMTSTDNYSLFIQKQSGIETRNTHIVISVPDQLSTLWASDDALMQPEGLTIDSKTDNLISELFEKTR